MASKKRAPDLTLQVLKDIRGDIRRTNLQLTELRAETRSGLTELRAESRSGFADVAQRFEEVGIRIVDSEVRTATAITDLAGTLHEVRDELRASLELRPRVENCEREIADIKNRLAPSGGSAGR